MPQASACSGCGKAVYRGKTSRPEIVCHECRRKNPASKYRQAACDECGTQFQSQRTGHSPTGWTRYCSRACFHKARTVAAGCGTDMGYRAHRLNHEEPCDRCLKAAAEARFARSRAGSIAAARRRRTRHRATWDGVSDEEILERDKWMCWICKRRIGKTLKYPHPRSASIDHLIPLALGGDDTAFNKKAAHIRCNIARQTGRPNEHPMLNFSLDTDTEIMLRKRGKSCITCGAIPGGDCMLHMPVHYFTCRACRRLFVHEKRGRVYCSTECSRAAMYVKHDQKIQTRPAHLRGLEAKAMRDAGMSLDEIADRLGYSGAPYAAAAIARATGQRSGRRTEPYVRKPRVA